MKLPVFDESGNIAKDEWKHFVVASVYHPYDDTYAKFNCELNDILSSIPSNVITFMAGDMNAQVGRRSPDNDDEFIDILGSFGLDKRNVKGEDLLHVYQANTLRILPTFFNHPNHVTFVSFNIDRTKSMLDMAAISSNGMSNVDDCRVVVDGIRSDHSAIRTELRHNMVTSIPSVVHQGEINRHDLQYDEHTNNAYNEHVSSRMAEIDLGSLTMEEQYDLFTEIMIEAAQATSSQPIKVNKSWFDYNKDVLLPLMEERNRLLHATRHQTLSDNDLEHIKSELRRMQKHIYDQSNIAIERWAQYHATKAEDVSSPRAQWEAVNVLSEGQFSHHKKNKSLYLKKVDGTLTQNDDEVADIAEGHFNDVTTIIVKSIGQYLQN